MQALRLNSPGALACMDVPLPIAGNDRVLVQVTHCALCRTDAKLCAEGHRDLRLPRIPGHEIVGIFPRAGRAVAVWPGQACGNCRLCRTGHENLCPGMQVLGFHADGGLAEWVAAPEESLLPIPENLSPCHATLAEPLGCCLHGLTRLGAPALRGDELLIHGGGPVGVMMAWAARETGWEPCVVEPDGARRERAASVLAGQAGGVVCQTPAKVFPAAVNATSAPEAFGDGLLRVAPGGRYLFFSGLASRANVSARAINEAHYREITLAGSYGCTRASMHAALALLEKETETAARLIDRTLPLHEAPDALAAIRRGEGMKRVVVFPVDL